MLAVADATGADRLTPSRFRTSSQAPAVRTSAGRRARMRAAGGGGARDEIPSQLLEGGRRTGWRRAAATFVRPAAGAGLRSPTAGGRANSRQFMPAAAVAAAAAAAAAEPARGCGGGSAQGDGGVGAAGHVAVAGGLWGVEVDAAGGLEEAGEAGEARLALVEGAVEQQHGLLDAAHVERGVGRELGERAVEERDGEGELGGAELVAGARLGAGAGAGGRGGRVGVDEAVGGVLHDLAEDGARADSDDGAAGLAEVAEELTEVAVAGGEHEALEVAHSMQYVHDVDNHGYVCGVLFRDWVRGVDELEAVLNQLVLVNI